MWEMEDCQLAIHFSLLFGAQEEDWVTKKEKELFEATGGCEKVKGEAFLNKVRKFSVRHEASFQDKFFGELSFADLSPAIAAFCRVALLQIEADLQKTLKKVYRDLRKGPFGQVKKLRRQKRKGPLSDSQRESLVAATARVKELDGHWKKHHDREGWLKLRMGKWSQLAQFLRDGNYDDDPKQFHLRGPFALRILSSDRRRRLLRLMVEEKRKDAGKPCKVSLVLGYARRPSTELSFGDRMKEFLIRTLTKIVTPPDFYRFGQMHAYFTMDNLAFHWFASSLVRVYSTKSDPSPFIPALSLDLNADFSSADRRDVRTLAELILRWNRNYTYAAYAYLPRALQVFVPSLRTRQNCQEFTLAAFRCIKHSPEEVPLIRRFQESMRSKLHASGRDLKNAHLNLLEFSVKGHPELQKLLRSAFTKVYDWTLDRTSEDPDRNYVSIAFRYHGQVDVFVREIQRVAPQFEAAFPQEFALLRGIDDAFWLRNLHSRKEMLGPDEEDIVEPIDCPFRLFGK